ncbi:MAG: hypothetical protein WAN46_20425 [Gammaproteobacteria bacterium]|jgi:hypothetical protein
MYLQQAGRGDEGWSEFNKLLVEGYPNQSGDESLVFMDHREIYDGMRLFLQRAKKPKHAIKLGVMSYLSGMLGLYYQDRTGELERSLKEAAIKSMLERHLKRDGKLDLLDECTAIILADARDFPSVPIGETAEKVEKVIFR